MLHVWALAKTQREALRHAAEGAALAGATLLGVLGKLGLRKAWRHAWPLRILASSKNVGIVHFQVRSQEVEELHHSNMLEQKYAQQFTSELSGFQLIYLFWSCFNWCFYCGNRRRSSVRASPPHGLKAALRTMPKLGR